MVSLQLSHDEPKLVYLALVYHLGRPGSEIDPATHGPLASGLQQVKTRLQDELEQAAPVVELDEWQLERLLSAMKGCVTEFRVYHMREGATSTVPGWTDTAEALFPQLQEERAVALDLAESMMMVQRRLQRAVSPARGT